MLSPYISEYMLLITLGNEYIKNNYEPTNLLDTNPVFDNVKTFTILGPNGEPLTDDIAYFFHVIKDKLALDELKLGHKGTNKNPGVPEYVYDSMANVGNQFWYIIGSSKSIPHFYIWQIEIELIEEAQKNHEKKIWDHKIKTVGIMDKEPLLQQTEVYKDFQNSKNELQAVLVDLISFCEEKGLQNWKKSFVDAQNNFSNDDPLNKEYLKNIFRPEDFSLEKKQLMGACWDAWLFGGMGFWDDQVFSDEESNTRYKELSIKLYDCLKNCILAIVNTHNFFVEK